MQRRLFVVLAAGLLSVAPQLRAEPRAPEVAAARSQAEIAARVAALLSETLPEELRGPLAQAKLGLGRAAAANKAGDADAEQRAIDIARAALALAEARAALSRERALLAAATRRGREGVRRNEAAKLPLEKARARLQAADAGP
jgi:hypothetical protein